MAFDSNKNIAVFVMLFAALLGVAGFFDKVLPVGLLLIAFLISLSLWLFNRAKIRDRMLYGVFFIALFIHLFAAFFMHYSNFQPFSGGRGDYLEYDVQGRQIAEKIQGGDYSIKKISEGIEISHYYPVIIGYLYAFTVPSMLMGQLLNAWILALAVVMVYLLVRELGGSKTHAFTAGMAANLYPSLMFFGTLMLREVFVVFFAVSALLFAVKLIKKFSWRNFIFFYILLGGVIHFRFYTGYPLLIAFASCWLLFSNLAMKKRLWYFMIIIPLLGFLPQFSNQGYFGFNAIKSYINPSTVVFYREIAYTSLLDQYTEPSAAPSDQADSVGPQNGESFPKKANAPQAGYKILGVTVPFQRNIDSTVVIKPEFDNPANFLKNYLYSFAFNLLGPFPWQLTKAKHLFVLGEVIPWFFVFLLSTWGAVRLLRKKYALALPLVIFTLLHVMVGALYFTNFGIITRIRISAFIAYLCFFPFGLAYVINLLNDKGIHMPLKAARKMNALLEKL